MTGRRLHEADAIFLPLGRAVGGEMAPIGVGVMAGPLDPEASAHQRELYARLVPNMRRRIVKDRVSIALPRWVDVPGAEPEDGWLELPAPGDGTLRGVLDWVARWALLPFPEDRPPWRSVQFDDVEVDGVPGRTVLVGQIHHAIIDAGGARRMLEHYLRFEEGAPLAPLPPREPLEDITAFGRWREGWAIEGAKAGALARRTGRRLRWATAQPGAASARARALVRASRKLQAAAGSVPLSPLLRRSSPAIRFDVMEVDIAALKAGARAAGGTVNDGFMAAMALALRAWHRDRGVEVPMLRAGMAIDRRAEGAGWEGNDVLAVVMPLPLDDDDPARLVQRCRTVSLRARDDEDVLHALELARAVGNRMPIALAAALSRRSLSGLDVSLSSSMGISARHWIGGVEELRALPLVVGSLSAVTIAMYSRGDLADLGMTSCPVAVPDPQHLLDRMAEGFAKVSSLAP